MNDNEKNTWEQISIKSGCYPYAIGRFCCITIDVKQNK